MSKMFAKEIAELVGTWGIGVYDTPNPALRTVFVGELPQNIEEGIFIIAVPSPPPHEYLDTEYPVLDFWARSSHTDRAYTLLEAIYNNFHRRYGYSTLNWKIYFSEALGTIVDVDRDRENGKLLRLSVQFICRNLNNLS